MQEFKEIPASRKSLAFRRPIYGKGINDAPYMSELRIDGVRVRCPFYRKWQNMLMRCYSSKYQEKYPTYVGCTACDEWLTFSNFRQWMEKQDWKEMHLDKDLLVYGNKVYSPGFCVFVPQSLNKLLNESEASRGEWPQGVRLHNQCVKFQSYCSVNGRVKHLGLFTTAEAACTAYKQFKSNHIKEVAQEHKSNTKLYNALMTHANLMLR